MDLSTIKAKSSELDVKHPGNGKSTGLFFEVVDKDHPNPKAKTNEQALVRIRAQQNQQIITPEENKQMSLEYNASRVVGLRWTGEANWNGKKPKYSHDLIVEMFAENPWLETFVAVEVLKEQRFFDK